MKKILRCCLVNITLLFLGAAESAPPAAGVITDQVPVGGYLYGEVQKLPPAEGALRLIFEDPGANRVVIAYGRQYRKDRKTREGSLELEREAYKPRLAEIAEEGKIALFRNLLPDFYDLMVIDPLEMTLYEGIALHKLGRDESLAAEVSGAFQEEIRQSLGLRQDRLGGWEGFFDHKQIERVEINEGRAGVLLQQMRLGRALAESGAVLQGTIHSLDVVWVERAIVAEAGWQVINRQQIYREELVAKEFFRHRYLPALQGVRIGSKERTLGPLKLK